jgi:hypothetical protein
MKLSGAETDWREMAHAAKQWKESGKKLNLFFVGQYKSHFVRKNKLHKYKYLQRLWNHLNLESTVGVKCKRECGGPRYGKIVNELLKSEILKFTKSEENKISLAFIHSSLIEQLVRYYSNQLESSDQVAMKIKDVLERVKFTKEWATVRLHSWGVRADKFTINFSEEAIPDFSAVDLNKMFNQIKSSEFSL